MDQDNNSSNFEFNAAYNKVFDLRTNLDDDGADSFFDLNINIKEEMMSPIQDSPAQAALDGTFSLGSNDSGDVGLDEPMMISQANSSESLTPVLPRTRRRSTSESFALTDKVSDNDPSVNSKVGVEDLNSALKNLRVSTMKTPLRKSVKFDGLPLLLPREKEHRMITRQDMEQNTPKLELRTRSITRSADNINNIRNEPFEVPRKRKMSPEAQYHTTIQPPQKFMSLAEAIRHFQNDTPDRFRSKPKGFQNMHYGRRMAHYEPRPTIPHSPPLQSQLRTRPVNHLTRQEEEQLEVEEIKKFKIKAVPLNKKVFHTPNLGKRVEVRPPTKIEPFKLTDVKKKEMPNEPTYVFTARPIPKNILEKPTGIGEKNPAKLTDPKTPSFIQRNKSARCVAEVIDDDSENLAAKDIYHFGVRCKRPTPRKAQRRSTIVQPFSFEERDKMMMIRKQETIQKYLDDEKKAREFHANPIPGTLSRKTSNSSMESETCVLPNMRSFSLLLNDGYAARRQEKIKKQLEEEAAQLKRDAVFKARPAIVLTQKPFIPKKSATPLKELPVFELNTERRAKEREYYEKKMKEKEEELDECRRQRKLLKEKEEKEAIAKIRLAAVHKAKPAPNVHKFEVHASDKPLTDPQSPRFISQSLPISPVLSLVASSLDLSE